MSLAVTCAVCASVLVVAVFGFDLNNFDQLDAAKRSPDKHIVIRDLFVPAGRTLELTDLQPGTVVEFSGRVTFGYQEYDGWMVRLKGSNIRVEGKPGNLLDPEGHRWWDRKGGNGGKRKPRFMQVTLSDSIVTGLNIKNTPKDCFIVNWSYNLRVENINIDIKDGDRKGGHNTDGFGVSGSQNVTVSNCQVHNQDDCFATTSGKDTIFENSRCTGGHGISVGSMGSGNVVERLTVRNCRIISNTNGIRIKTRKGEPGAVRDVTFDNIELVDISQYGIIIQGNYHNSGARGDPTLFPIHNLVINNVRGHVSRKGTNILVWVDPSSVSNWRWNSDVSGGQKERVCKGVPRELNYIRCGRK